MTVPTIDCQRFDELLSEYLESTLSLPQRATVDAHAAECARCGALLEDIRAITDRASALPLLEPSRDLWPAIAREIDAPVVSIATAASVRRGFRVPVWARLAAAAAVLVTVTSLVTQQWVQRGDQAGGALTALPAAPRTTDSLGSETTAVAPAPTLANNPGERERVSAAVTYSREIERMEAFVRERGSALDPATTAIIENSMRIIDSALVEARRALARDTASRFLMEQVDKTLQKKMELLRSVTLLAART